MLTVEELIRNLARSEVTEIALMTGRLPCVKVDGAYKPVDETARSADAILKILTKLGGARYLDDLGAKAVQWTTRVDGVGTIAVSAVDRAGNVQARMVLLKKETAAAPPPAPPPMSAPAVSTVAAARKPPPPDDDGLGLDLELDTSAPTPIAPPKREAAPDISPPTPIVPYDLEAAPRAVAHPQTKAIEDASFDALVSAARADRVSDLHLISERPPLFRVAGDLVPRGPVLSVREVERMIATVVPERLRGELERDGAVDFAMQLNGGEFRGKRILSEASVKAMHEPQFGGTYAFGFSVRKDPNGHTIISHSGGIPGQSSYMVGDLDAKVGVYFMSNSGAPATIGEAALNLPARLGPGIRPHLYGKREARPGRKMGHLDHIVLPPVK